MVFNLKSQSFMFRLITVQHDSLPWSNTDLQLLQWKSEVAFHSLMISHIQINHKRKVTELSNSLPKESLTSPVISIKLSQQVWRWQVHLEHHLLSIPSCLCSGRLPSSQQIIISWVPLSSPSGWVQEKEDSNRRPGYTSFHPPVSRARILYWLLSFPRTSVSTG